MSYIELSGKKYPVEINIADKRTSSVRLRDGKVVIRLSRHLRGEQRDLAMEKFLVWARKKLLVLSGIDYLEPQYSHGGRIVTHNRIYEVVVLFEGRKNIKCNLNDNVITVLVPSGREYADVSSKITSMIKKIIISDQQSYLEEVIHELNLLYFRVEPMKVFFKDVKGRFGSCSSKGEIMLAYRLLFAPRDVFKYVCIHELAHMKEFNHSPKFWSLVNEAMPDYKVAEKWLKDKGWNLG